MTLPSSESSVVLSMQHNTALSMRAGEPVAGARWSALLDGTERDSYRS